MQSTKHQSWKLIRVGVREQGFLTYRKKTEQSAEIAKMRREFPSMLHHDLHRQEQTLIKPRRRNTKWKIRASKHKVSLRIPSFAIPPPWELHTDFVSLSSATAGEFHLATPIR